MLTQRRIRRGVFHSVPDLIAAIEAYLAAYNKDAKPFVWTAEVEKIMEKIARAAPQRAARLAAGQVAGWRIASRSCSWRRTPPQTWSQRSNTLGSVIE